MGIGLPLICLPAVASLVLKGGIYAYARLSGTHNLQTRLYLGFLFALSLQNVAELFGLYALNVSGVMPYVEARLFYAATIIAFPFLFHLAVSLALNEPHWARKILPQFVYAWAILLQALLFLTPWLIKDFEILKYGIGDSLTRVPGPLYALFALYAIGIFCGTVGMAIYGARKQDTAQKRLKNSMLLVAVIPMTLLVLVVLTLLHFGIKWLNWSVTFPVAVTFFLAITAYATHQHRLFDIQFYIPWSKVRKRKTAFYDRIRAIIAEISDLEAGSVKQALERVADTLRCSAALVGGPAAPILAADRAQNMASMPVDQLRGVHRITVANEIEQARPEIYATMKRHGVAAIVPFYPHSQNAASWLLLSDSFSEHVYTPLDFRMVEQLFDKMAELFLDKLLAMRAQLTHAYRQIQTLEVRLQGTETNVAALQSRIDILGQENLRLTREQPADALLAASRSAENPITITLLGRDKTMLKRLRTRFPQVEQFVGPDSSSFRRRSLPNILVCDVDGEDDGARRKFLELITQGARRCAILLCGNGAEKFAFDHRQGLLSLLIEVLPATVTDEAVVRKMEALVELRRSLFAAVHPDYPLVGRSPVYAQAMLEVQRIARFAEPVLLKSPDLGEAAAVGAYMHELSKAPGAFRVLHASKFLKNEANTSGGTDDEELSAVLNDVRHGTLMIDNICALPNETWDRLLTHTGEFAETRLLAACPTSASQSPDALFKPLQPLVVELPTLRERRLDVPALVHYYTLQFNLQAGTSRYLSQADLDELMASTYPEDLTLLKNAVFDGLRAKERKSMKAPEFAVLPDKTLDQYVAEFEARIIEQTLKRCGGNKSKAARLLGLRPNTLHYKLERYGIRA